MVGRRERAEEEVYREADLSVVSVVSFLFSLAPLSSESPFSLIHSFFPDRFPTYNSFAVLLSLFWLFSSLFPFLSQ